MLPPFAKKVYKGTNRPNQQSIKVVEDWLSNQPENKLREDSWEHWLQLEFPWQSAYYQKCLVPDFELIERHQKKKRKKCLGSTRTNTWLRISIRIPHHLFMEAGNSQLERG